MLARFAAEASQRGNAVTDAYCRGVCCYCVLEQQTSPFVQYSAEMIHRIEENKSVADSKNQVESALDIILLRYETAKLPTEFDLRTTVPLDEPLCKTIALFYAAICRELGHSEWSADEIGPLFEDGCKAIGKLNDRTLMKRQFLKRREKRQGKSGGVSSLMRNISEDEDYDYANVCEQEWQWPMESGDIRTDTYFALYESAVQKAEQRLAHWNPIMNG
ncbi:MAG: hypothetical protein PUC32_04600 [Oscillospiraceae bacterium]|nr:hypothetical protein [Oscillospiraceae bacterium]